MYNNLVDDIGRLCYGKTDASACLFGCPQRFAQLTDYAGYRGGMQSLNADRLGNSVAELTCPFSVDFREAAGVRAIVPRP